MGDRKEPHAIFTGYGLITTSACWRHSQCRGALVGSPTVIQWRRLMHPQNAHMCTPGRLCSPHCVAALQEPAVPWIFIPMGCKRSVPLPLYAPWLLVPSDQGGSCSSQGTYVALSTSLSTSRCLLPDPGGTQLCCLWVVLHDWASHTALFLPKALLLRLP